MAEVGFTVLRAEAVADAAVPLIGLAVRVVARPAEAVIHGVALRVQVRLDVARRRYSAVEEQQLGEIFGAPAQWAQSLKSLLWTNLSVNVPAFAEETTVDLELPCTFDLHHAAAKYLYGLEEGDVPLTLLFSGSVFHVGDEGTLQVAPIPWSQEDAFRVPIATWRAAMDMHYAGRAAFEVSRDLFDRVQRYRVRRGLASWDAALASLLAAAEVQV